MERGPILDETQTPETFLSLVEAALLVLTGSYLLSQAYVLYQIHGMHLLEDIEAPAPSTWPTVTLIVPACNEEGTIEDAMKTLLAIDYPALQILAINDRSTDATGDLLDGLAQDHPQLKVIHIDALPGATLNAKHRQRPSRRKLSEKRKRKPIGRKLSAAPKIKPSSEPL